MLSHHHEQGSVIVCNGYKDREYIRHALLGNLMGHKVYIVVEKPSELEMVLDESVRLNIKPNIGVRAKLASTGSGMWESSGGSMSKFGLSASRSWRWWNVCAASASWTACNCCTSTWAPR